MPCGNSQILTKHSTAHYNGGRSKPAATRPYVRSGGSGATPESFPSSCKEDTCAPSRNNHSWQSRYRRTPIPSHLAKRAACSGTSPRGRHRAAARSQPPCGERAAASGSQPGMARALASRTGASIGHSGRQSPVCGRPAGFIARPAAAQADAGSGTPSPQITPTVSIAATPQGSPTPTPSPAGGNAPVHAAAAPAGVGETLTIPFASGTTGVRTSNSYTGPVTLTVSGTGQAAGCQYSDAFYIYAGCSGTPYNPPQHYNLQ